MSKLAKISTAVYDTDVSQAVIALEGYPVQNWLKTNINVQLIVIGNFSMYKLLCSYKHLIENVNDLHISKYANQWKTYNKNTSANCIYWAVPGKAANHELITLRTTYIFPEIIISSHALIFKWLVLTDWKDINTL